MLSVLYIHRLLCIVPRSTDPTPYQVYTKVNLTRAESLEMWFGPRSVSVLAWPEAVTASACHLDLKPSGSPAKETHPPSRAPWLNEHHHQKRFSSPKLQMEGTWARVESYSRRPFSHRSGNFSLSTSLFNTNQCHTQSGSLPRSTLLPEFSYSGTEGGHSIPPHFQNRSSTAQSQPLGNGSNPLNPHPPEPRRHIYFLDPKASSQESSRVGQNLMNQIPRMRFTQPLDFRFATA